LEIVIAGASGYIGRAIVPALRKKFPDARLTLLSRSSRESRDPAENWKACDLFSLKSLEEALPAKVDLALYLVHSMGPTAHLDQGSFADYDLILADNFGRALRRTGVRHVIYLGGLLPQGGELSPHLESRWEVEETFRSHRLPTTVFRAAIILGEAGSSTQILVKLVRRLPVMLCPKWTQTLTSPVDLDTVLSSIVEASLDPRHYDKIYDLASAEPLTYIDMMRETARALGRTRLFVPCPLFTPTLSRLWVSLITNTSRALVYPLIQSLAHPMVARPDHQFPTAKPLRSYRDVIRSISLRPLPSGGALLPFRPAGRTVRSVQRLPLPRGKSAASIRRLYLHWLPRFMKPWIEVKVFADDKVTFSFTRSSKPLLELSLSRPRSTPDRQLLYITGGILQSGEKGRLEFREVLGGRYLLAAIHEYRPALPWFVYKLTQAKAHLAVMRAFGRRLGKRR